MPLKFDPLQVFHASKTPCGLYARRLWLGEEDSRRWRSDLDETVAALSQGRSPNGSWGFSATKTIQALFGLHLAEGRSDAQIDKGLDWLLLRLEQSLHLNQFNQYHCKAEELSGLPFIQSRYDCFLIGATLWLSTLFERGDHARVSGHYEQIANALAVRGSHLGERACTCNLLHALVVHPTFSQSAAVQRIVAELAQLQEPSGEWPQPVSFFRTLNALSYLKLPEAHRQIERAYRWLQEKQYEDGAWGTGEQEWNAFLTVQALKRCNLL